MVFWFAAPAVPYIVAGIVALGAAFVAQDVLDDTHVVEDTFPEPVLPVYVPHPVVVVDENNNDENGNEHPEVFPPGYPDGYINAEAQPVIDPVEPDIEYYTFPVSDYGIYAQTCSVDYRSFFAFLFCFEFVFLLGTFAVRYLKGRDA